MSDIAAKSKASSFRVSQIAMIGVVTAVTCVLGPLALPIGLPSTAQIALELGLTERAVEGRLYRLKRQLRKLPGGDEGA